MKQIITKKIAQELKELKGEIRGVILKADIQFIIDEKGKEGIKRVEKEMASLDFPFEYEKIKSMHFYPIGLRVVSLLVIKKVLGFSDKKIQEMGFDLPRSLPLVRMYTRFFAMDKKTFFNNAVKFWKRIVMVGEFETSLDEKNKQAISTLKNFDIHPILCIYLLGVIPSFHKMATGAREVIGKETKCSFKGDELHEFLVKHKY